MTSFRLSPEAAQDLIEIYEYIAQDSLEAAERAPRTAGSDAQIGADARLGHTREDLSKRQVLFWPIRAYQIIYRSAEKPLEVVAVLHGKRNLRRILKDR